MILDFNTYCLNEATLRTLKKTLHGVLGSKDRASMRKLLRHHIVRFKFKKKNGDIRYAVGTLISSYLPALRGGSPKPEHQMVYYDLEKEHWRSFRSYSFIKILDVKSEDEYKGKPKHKPIHKEVEKEEDEEIKKKHIPDEKDKHEHKHPSDDEKDVKKDKETKDEDVKKKEYKVGDKIPEKELMRRSTDFRKHSRKNDFTKKSNDAKKKGELEDEEEDED